MRESDIQNQILIALSKQGTIAFRINAGSFWAGEILSNKDNMLLMKNPRKVQGAPEGTSDIIGVTSVMITTQMVGSRVGVFTAIEVKKPGQKPKPHQEHFLLKMHEMGAIAGVASSLEQAIQIVKGEAKMAAL